VRHTAETVMQQGSAHSLEFFLKDSFSHFNRAECSRNHLHWSLKPQM